MPRPSLSRKTVAASWICSGTEGQRLPRLLTGTAGKVGEKFALPLGVHPGLAVVPVVESTGTSGHPHFLQRLLQVHDDLAVVRKGDGDHAAHALVIDVGIGQLVDAVTGQLNGDQQGFRAIQILGVGHYNAITMKISRILGAIPAHTRIVGGAMLIALGLLGAGCGQKGPLYLPSPQAAKRPAAVKRVLPVENSPAVVSPTEVVPAEVVPAESDAAEPSTEPATETTP